jgi:ADP-ribose pyrophosphatase YjhB (NUDIX family)
MASNPTDSSRAVSPFTDPRDLTARDDVPVHVDRDVVPSDQFDTLTDLDDMAIVGVTRDDGRVLLRRLTADCDWKLPVVDVAADEEFVAAALSAVEDVVGLPVALEGVAGVWRLEAETEDGRTTTREFVVFEGAPASDPAALDLPVDVAADDAPAEVGWFEAFPEGGAPLPGNDLFFE